MSRCGLTGVVPVGAAEAGGGGGGGGAVRTTPVLDAVCFGRSAHSRTMS